MGLSSKRHYTLQSSIWAFYGLVTICTANQTITNTSKGPELSRNEKGLSEGRKELSESGKEALILICFGLILITIISIFAHYCNFEVGPRKSYKKLQKSSEMVDVNLYESEEDAHTAS